MQTQTFNIALPRELVKKVDQVTKREYKNRSEFIREALRMYLIKMEKWSRIFKAGEKAVMKAGIKSPEELDDLVYEFRHGRKSS